MKKKICFLIALVPFSMPPAFAEWSIGTNLGNYNEKFGDESFTYTLASVSLEYKFSPTDNWKVTPFIKVGTGIGDESTSYSLYLSGLQGRFDTAFTSAEFEVDRVLELGVRAEYFFSAKLYSYGVASNLDLDVTATAFSDDLIIDFSRTVDQFGLGLGLGYIFDDSFSSEISAQRFATDDFFNLSLKYEF